MITTVVWSRQRERRECYVEGKDELGIIQVCCSKNRRGWTGVDTSRISRIDKVEGVLTKESTKMGIRIRKGLTEWKEGGKIERIEGKETRMAVEESEGPVAATTDLRSDLPKFGAQRPSDFMLLPWLPLWWWQWRLPHLQLCQRVCCWCKSLISAHKACNWSNIVLLKASN